MRRLFLVRHGETELNRMGRLQGNMDSKLTKVGRYQAQRVAQKLQQSVGASNVTLCVSPLGRAQMTAGIIAEALSVAKFQTDARLAEIGLGDWEGMTMEDIEFTHPGALDGSDRLDWAYRAPNGEAKAAFLARLESWLSDVPTRPGVIVAVSHGWTGLGLRSIYTGLPFEKVSARGDSHEAVFEFIDESVREF